MVANILLYAGAIITIGWGIAHIFAARVVVKGFRDISEDNKKFILMEWVAEGLTLCFIGVLVILTNILGGTTNEVSGLYSGFRPGAAGDGDMDGPDRGKNL